MFQRFFPNEYYDSTYHIDFQAFYDKGYRAVLFDVDNTLVEHDQPVTIEAIALFEKLRKIGFEVCIISNNKEPRVKPSLYSRSIVYICKQNR